jgi:hypothetical protein
MQVRQGYVWVWGASGASAAAEAAAAAPLLIPEMDPDDIGRARDSGRIVSAAARYMRDLPYRYMPCGQRAQPPFHSSPCDHAHSGSGCRFCRQGMATLMMTAAMAVSVSASQSNLHPFSFTYVKHPIFSVPGRCTVSGLP